METTVGNLTQAPSHYRERSTHYNPVHTLSPSGLLHRNNKLMTLIHHGDNVTSSYCVRMYY